MAAATFLASVLQQLRTIASAKAYEERSDPELLKLFLAEREEAAFAALVKRHGPMVLQVCRRIQGNEQDAEDIFQATFLLLSRKASSISKPESLASWLHGVAHRLALEAKAKGTRRQTYERQAADIRGTSDGSEETWHDLQETLDEALRQVPEKYRLPLLLCYLEGKTQEEAARQLGCPLGTLRSRLARGRERLKKILERHGVSLSAGALTAGLTRSAASAAVPPLLVHATTRAALAYAAGKTAAALVSARAAALVEAGLKAMLTANIKIVTMVLLAVGTLGLGAGAAVTRVRTDFAPETASPGLSDAKESHPALVKPPAPPFKDASNPPNPKVSADPTAGEPAVVYGRVVDPDGKPVPSARVLYQQKRWRDSPAGFYGAPVSRNTDGNGQFRFTVMIRGRTPFRPYNPVGTLAAVAPGYAPAAIEVGAPEELKDFTLRLVKDDVPIEGRIIDLQGKPVAGASVRLVCIRANLAGDLKPWLDAIQNDRDIPHQAYLGILFTAAQVGLHRTAVTDADGRFRLTGIGRERIAALRLDGPSIETQFLFVMTRLGKTIRLDNKGHQHLARGASLIHGARFEQAVAPATPVEGMVRDLDTGQPIAGATVQEPLQGLWADWDDESLTTTTDHRGRYKLVGRPRQSVNWIRASAPAGLPYLPVLQRPAEAVAGQSIKLDFGLKRGLLIQGRVTDKATAKPIQAEVEYLPLADNPFLRGVEKYPISETTSSTKDGSFTLVGLPGPGVVAAKLDETIQGCYLLGPGVEQVKGYDPKQDGFVSKRKIAPAWMYNVFVSIEPGEKTEAVSCDLQFDRGKIVTGTCAGPDGHPITGVTINGPVGHPTNIGPLHTPQFTLYAIDPEKPAPFFFYDKEKKLAAAVLVKGDEREGFTVRLNPAAIITGRLMDEDGIPWAGVSIIGDIKAGQLNLRVGWGGFFWSQTDKDGRFRIEGLIPGVRVGARLYHKDNPVKNKVGGLVFDQLTLKPGEVRDLGDIRVNDPR